jgi:repressor LexA
MAEVDLVGQVAASFGYEAVVLDNDERKRLPIPRWLVGHGDLVMVRVFGTSMIDAAIAPGDLAVIRKQQQAESGEIVAARLPGHAATDATIKEFKRDETGRAWLIPRNPADQQPIPADDAEILGKVVTVMRMLR